MHALDKALARINLAAVLDHSGRAGNAFFLTSFDRHPSVLACPLMHYSYSYYTGHFGEQTEVNAQQAHEFITKINYFRLLYNPTQPEHAELIYRMGGDKLPIPAEKIRTLCNSYFANKTVLSRKECILIPFLIYAQAMQRDLDKIQYILISDAVSLRTENINTGFSGKVIDFMRQDFPQVKLISLVRDPRATFASPRHQFVNSLGNMYAIKPGNFWQRLKQLYTRQLTPDNGCVYLYWLLYLAQSARTIYRKKTQYPQNFITIKNEDLNCDFYSTVQKICLWLQVDLTPAWQQHDFTPTMLGTPWQGTGAYNNRYQPKTKGLLENDSQEVSKNIAGPNEYVTKRWQKKLNRYEIKLIEFLFAEEMQDMGYPPFEKKACIEHLNWQNCWHSFEGEIPSANWLRKGLTTSGKEFLSRCYYAVAFIPFYFFSRIQLLYYVNKIKFFENICKNH